MNDTAFLLVALGLSIGGMTCFALSITAHWRQAFGERQQSRSISIVLRFCGAALLAAAFVGCAAADPVSMAMLVWPMLLTIAAAVVALSLTLHAALVRRRSSKVAR